MLVVDGGIFCLFRLDDDYLTNLTYIASTNTHILFLLNKYTDNFHFYIRITCFLWVFFFFL